MYLPLGVHSMGATIRLYGYTLLPGASALPRADGTGFFVSWPSANGYPYGLVGY
jgi:hypothetical protein